MDVTAIAAGVSGLCNLVSIGWIAYLKHNEKKNKGLIDLELAKIEKAKGLIDLEVARIEKACGDFDELVAELKKEREEHKETREAMLAALSNSEVMEGQLTRIQDVIYCMDPIMLYACQKDPKLATVYERYKKLVEQDNTDLGRD